MSNKEETLVLVADDEPSTLALVTAHVRSKGFKVVEASDGDMAWQLAHEHLPDLVILDVMMPGMSGWEVCRKIRESLPLAHTGVIMLTGIGENLNEMTSPLYGADTHIDKPFEFTDLDEKIEETLSRRRSGSFGRPDRADEELPVEEVGRHPVPTQPSPPISKEPKTPPAKKATPAKLDAVERPRAKAPTKSEGAAPAEKAPKQGAKKLTKKVSTKKAAERIAKQAAKASASKKAAKKTAAKKPAAKKTAAKKTAAKKPAAKKAPAKKTAAKKTAAKKAPAKKAPAKKTPAKKTPAKKTPAKKTPAKKAAKKAAPARKK